MERYWVYLDNKVQGPVEIPSLRKLTGFNLLTQVCPEGQENWKMADQVIEIKAYFAAPPRGSSLIPEQTDLPAERPQLEFKRPDMVIETLDEPAPQVIGNTALQPNAAPAPAGLRVSCAQCGYKNPRDVHLCMKCGGSLSAGAKTTAAESKPPITLSPLSDSMPSGKESAAAMPVVTAAAPLSVAAPVIESPMVEIPVTRIAWILAGVLVAGGTLFAVRQMWRGKHHTSTSKHAVVVKTVTPPANTSGRAVSGKKSKRAVLAALPGVSTTRPTAEPAAKVPKEPKEIREPKKQAVVVEEASEGASKPASYTVLNQAYPLQHRTPAPVDSPYSVKRRGERGLWSDREQEAVGIVQSQRIYGGTRTIQRNAEILMQILRDREYNSAFESGKRLYLFNDADWAASQKEGPMQEVRLTFSGGREADGSPRAPLRFAFAVDLDRRTVEPGGSGMIKANTMHAFFDESRIPPEERRSVAKDTEELIRAAQPGASPLALDQISKKYAATYSFPALSRVAATYGLTIVNKKLARETASVSEILPDSPAPAQSPAKTPSASPSKPILKLAASQSGAIQYTMENGTGKEKLVTATAPSRATPNKLWETLTSYDRFTQFVPDVLVSRREGQDGKAIIVNTVSLTRLMFFVFKINLHLRILEYPQQHRLEFERIAGDFEKFSGYIEITPDPTGQRSDINVKLTLAPKGFTPNWALRAMAPKFLVPVLDAVRSKAEAN